ncbi:MAG: MFS transporter [Chloroflexi bacterium]|nr:MFS transporter [Chloroflexota bacterium]
MLTSTRDVLRDRNFRLLWLGQSLSVFGDGVINLGLLILIERLTGSTAALATMAVIMALPYVFLGPVAGVYVDHWDRKRVMILADLVRGLLVLGYILGARPGHLWVLYLIGFLMSSVSTFFSPARSALMASLLPESLLLPANSFSQMSEILMRVLGMAAAGALLSRADLYWPLCVVDSFTFFASMALVSLIRAPRGHREEVVQTVSDVWREIQVGIRTIFRSRVLTGILMAAGITMLGMGAINILFVPFLLNDLHVSPTWFSAVQGAQSASMILSGALVATLAARVKPTRIVTFALMGIGLGIGAISQVHSIWQVLGILFFIGGLVTPFNASISTLSQTMVSDALRGRMGASLNMLVTTANIASMAVAGVLADLLGVRMVFILAGGLAIVASLVAAWMFRDQPSASIQ